MWRPEGSGLRGFSIAYQSIVMHAVSRDTAGFHSACIYLQLDADDKIDVSEPPTNGSATPQPMETDGGEESEADDEDDEDAAQEVRVVPVGGEGGLDATLDRLFEALSACAALNPDAADGDESDEFEPIEVGGAPADEYSDDAATALDPRALQEMLDTSSLEPAQLAMLQRYDAMLEASGGVPAVDNTDGRFDDADDDDAQP